MYIPFVTPVDGHDESKTGVAKMKLITTVTVKQILTENSKQNLFERFSERKLQLQKEIEQFRFEMKRMEKSKKYSIASLHEYFDREIDDRKEKLKVLDFQLEQLELLPLGAELKDRDIQGMVEVQIGDNWNDILLGKTIIVKDGVIEAIK